MKKRIRFLSVLLAIVMALTSIGTVFAEDAPPPVDDQGLLPSGGAIYPLDSEDYYNSIGIPFNWQAVDGADKYKFELQYRTAYYNPWVPLSTQMVFSKKYPIPPTTATVVSKKPFKVAAYRWRVTAINTDVGSNPDGSNQVSEWWSFVIGLQNVDPYAIFKSYPQAAAALPVYDSGVAKKYGYGTNLPNPDLYWEMSDGEDNPKTSALVSKTTTQFVVTLSQGKNKWSKTVAASAACTDVDTANHTCTCHTDFSGFSGKTGALSGLTPGVLYNWEVYGKDNPGSVFGDGLVTIPAYKNTLEYNPPADKYPYIQNVVLSDTEYTNKPTFKWDQPAGGLPAKGAYQLVVESQKSGPPFTEDKWKPIYVQAIVPGKTNIPGTKTLACKTSDAACYWFFKAPFGTLNYRWNIRILASGKYGPWAPISDNLFYVARDPLPIEIDSPLDNTVMTDAGTTLEWVPPFVSDYYATDYTFMLKRVSPGPLSKTINVTVSTNPLYATHPVTCSDTIAFCSYEIKNLLPAAYTSGILPRGVYQIQISPQSRLENGQFAVFSAASKGVITKFTVGPAAPVISSAVYDGANKKLGVTFTPEAAKSYKDVKYRILVKMIDNGLSRWIKVGTVAGASCASSASPCTIDFTVYKPGSKLALDQGYVYQVQIQEAMKEEGSATKWGPFGPLSAAPGTAVTFK